MFPGTNITTAVFILFPLTLYLAAAADIDNVYSALSCKTTSSDLFSTNSTYTTNLESLLESLSNSLSLAPSGFANATYGSNLNNTVYGLALCRGDASIENCTTCVSLAKSILRANCSGIKEAIVWREWCMLRYANRHIFSSLEFDPAFTLNDVGNTDVVAGFGWKQVLNITLNNVTGRAAAASGGKKFATKEAAYKAPNNKQVTEIYSMAQCTPDLTTPDCSKCLLVAMRKLPLQLQAGTVLTPSCHIRYASHPFYQNDSVPEPLPVVPTPPPPPPPPPGRAPPGDNRRKRVAETVGISAGTSIGISALLGIGRWYYKRYNGNPLSGSEDVGIGNNDMTGNPTHDESFNQVCAATDQNLAPDDDDRELEEDEPQTSSKGKPRNNQEIEAKRNGGRRHKQTKK